MSKKVSLRRFCVLNRVFLIAVLVVILPSSFARAGDDSPSHSEVACG